MNSASGLPAEIVFGIVIAVALWTIAIYIGFKKVNPGQSEYEVSNDG